MKKVNPYRRKKTAQHISLQDYRQEYEHLKRELRQIGYICLGSVIQRWIPCGNPSCACHKDPSRRHGPYYQWTRKVAGKTQTRMLTQSLAKLYRQGIRNHRRLDAVLDKMREVSLAAFEAAKIQSKR